MNRGAALLLATALAGIACGAPASAVDAVGDGQWYVRSQDAHKVLRQAVENAVRSNVIVVAATGNTSRSSVAGYPGMREVVHRLTATATDRGPSGKDDRYGHGMLDVVAALTATVPPLPHESPSAKPTPGSMELTAPSARFPVALALLVTGIAATIAALILGATVIALISRRQKSVSSSRSMPRRRS